MTLVSIIVPVYNSEHYIDRCIESILNQTIADWELILVDDGSQDGSGKLCDSYAVKDSRINIYHKTNGGVSTARNFGIDKAKGEWLCFIDSDDYIESNYLEVFFNIPKSEMPVQGFVSERVQGKVYHGITGSSPHDLNRLYCEMEKSRLLNSPCYKLYRTKIIKDNGLYFDTAANYGEDHLFTLNYMLHIQSFSYTHNNGYVYNYLSEGSLSRGSVPVDSQLYYLLRIGNLIYKVGEHFKVDSFSLTSVVNNRLYVQTILLLYSYLVSKHHDYVGYCKLIEHIKETKIGIHGLSFYDSIRLIMIIYLPCFLSYNLLRTFVRFS